MTNKEKALLCFRRSRSRAPIRQTLQHGTEIINRQLASRRRTGGQSFLQKALFGARSQVVYFIAKGPGQPLAQAKSCVERNLRRAPSAYCFAFSSERAFRFSHVSRHPPAKMERPCWVAYWGKPSGRRAIGSSTNPAAVPLHCPGAIG